MEKVLIFGASVGGRRGHQALPKDQKAVAFVDNDSMKHGSRLLGLPVISPKEIKHTPHDRILIASTYQSEILQELKKMGIPLDRIDLIDPDVLNGIEDPAVVLAPWAILGAVMVGLAIYGLVCLLFG